MTSFPMTEPLGIRQLIPRPELSPILILSPAPNWAPFSILTFLPQYSKIFLHSNCLILNDIPPPQFEHGKVNVLRIYSTKTDIFFFSYSTTIFMTPFTNEKLQAYTARNIYHPICKPDGILQSIILTLLEHGKTIHQLPYGTGHHTIVVGLGKEVYLFFLVR